MKRILSMAALGFSFFATAAAFAADGYVTGDVNLRAGPDSSYPSVVMLSAGSPVAIDGCVNGWSWCDVASGDDRGWVAGDFLQEEYQGQRVLVPTYGAQIGIPIVSFVFGTYWDDHYRNRSWYGERARWSQVRPQYGSAHERGGSYGNARGGSYGNSRGVSSRDSRSSSAPNSRTRTGVATTRTSYQGRTSNTGASRHSVATNVRSSGQNASRAQPTQRNAVAPRAAMTQHRAVAQPRTMAVHNAAQPRTTRAAPAKSAPKQGDGKDKNQH